ncbi:MAG TPA: polysaccharide deacetylase family protein [Miltoncostaeaceae bacterium]|nr:polysaccharide deacetylase family protein [Miltoncostaeaceae bacterium]
MAIGALGLLVAIAWVANARQASDDTPSSPVSSTVAAATTTTTGAESEAPARPAVDPKRRMIARMAAANRSVANGGGHEKLVALTFDDGPGPLTMKFLALLNRLKVPATFYVQGSLLEQYPQVLKATVADGHELGVHGWGHQSLTGLYGADLQHEIVDTRDLLRSITGVDAATFRPPYGAVDERVLRDLAPQRMLSVLWDVDTNDWRGYSADQIADHVLQSTTAGSIVLMHDGGTARQQTLNSLPRMIEGLRAKGIEFVTVSELMERNPPTELASRDTPRIADTPATVSGPTPEQPSYGEEPSSGG